MPLFQPKLYLKNISLNFLSRIFLFVLAIATIPFVVHNLGNDRYGILSIILIVLGYFTVFDVGMRTSATRFIARAREENNEKRVADIVIIMFLMAGVIGFLGTLVFFLFSDFFARYLLNVPRHLVGETALLIKIAAPLIVSALLTGIFIGVLEARQRFDLINEARVCSGTIQLLIPVLVIIAGGDLTVMVVLMLVKSVCFLFVYYLLSKKVTGISFIASLKSISFKGMRPLVSFSGWVQVQNIASAFFLNNPEPFLIGIFLSTTYVTFYAIPLGILEKLAVIPESIVIVLFPAFSLLFVRHAKDFKFLFIRAVKYVFFLTFYIAVLGAAFADIVVLLWLGPDYMLCVPVIRILLAAFVLSSLCWLFNSYLLSAGYSKLVTIILLCLIIPHIGLGIFLIKIFSVAGAAAAYFILRFAILVSYAIAIQRLGLGIKEWRTQWSANTVKGLAGIATLALCLVAARYVTGTSLWGAIANMALFTAAYGVLAWRCVAGDNDRKFILETIHNARCKRA